MSNPTFGFHELEALQAIAEKAKLKFRLQNGAIKATSSGGINKVDLVFDLIFQDPHKADDDILTPQKRLELAVRQVCAYLFKRYPRAAFYAMVGGAVTHKLVIETHPEALAKQVLTGVKRTIGLLMVNVNIEINIDVNEQLDEDLHEEIEKAPIQVLDARLDKLKVITQQAGLPMVYDSNVDPFKEDNPKIIIAGMTFTNDEGHIAPLKVKVKHLTSKMAGLFGDLLESGMVITVPARTTSRIQLDAEKITDPLELEHMMTLALDGITDQKLIIWKVTMP